MHPSVDVVLSGIEACRRYLRQHPGAPVKAVNRRFDYAEAAPQSPVAGPHLPSVIAGPAAGPGPRSARWVELRPHTGGIAIQIVDGERRTLAGSLLYPYAPSAAHTETCGIGECDDHESWLDFDAEAITAPPFLTKLAAAATRALEQLDSFPEALHG